MWIVGEAYVVTRSQAKKFEIDAPDFDVGGEKRTEESDNDIEDQEQTEVDPIAERDQTSRQEKALDENSEKLWVLQQEEMEEDLPEKITLVHMDSKLRVKFVDTYKKDREFKTVYLEARRSEDNRSLGRRTPTFNHVCAFQDL
ncbi:hypothetical protein BDZ89DRAFT_1055382 [Hymenopellis radicata]|nr:hypothetical protein BDZ89DRAFT_1055382 [Hymenopellis radicata]